MEEEREETQKIEAIDWLSYVTGNFVCIFTVHFAVQAMLIT